ncbi:MAG: serine hydrolase, partial [Burkholderiales bacterium]
MTSLKLLAVLLGLALFWGMDPAYAASPSTKAKTSSIKAKKVQKRVVKRSASTNTSATDPGLRSAAALVLDHEQGGQIYGKNVDTVMPIASITKLMTAIVVLDSKLPLDEMIAIDSADVDTVRNSGSKLRVGTKLSREELLLIALMASENRAAAALARSYPGGTGGFIEAMNAKAKLLAMDDTRFVDPTGLRSENVSTAHDLARLVAAAHDYELIREHSTTPAH